VASSDDFANDTLTAIVEAGGSWYFGLLDAVPPDDLSTFSLISEIPAETIARNSATWDVANREAYLAAPLTLDTSSVVADVVPVAWCLFDDSGRTTPRIAGRLADIKVTPGSDVTVPAATVTIRYPATVAATL
jgi:hypothetical protein